MFKFYPKPIIFIRDAFFLAYVTSQWWSLWLFLVQNRLSSHFSPVQLLYFSLVPMTFHEETNRYTMHFIRRKTTTTQGAFRIERGFGQFLELCKRHSFCPPLLGCREYRDAFSEITHVTSMHFQKPPHDQNLVRETFQNHRCTRTN